MKRLLPLAVTWLFAASVPAQSADVSVTVSGQQNASQREFHLLYALVNHGPDPARNVVVTIEVPSGVTIQGVGLGSGNVMDPCDAQARPIVCRAGDVQPGLPFHYGGMIVNTPIADASYEIKVTATSETSDPNAANNSGTASFATRIEADMTVLVLPRADRVDPGGSGSFTVYVGNRVIENRPPTVRVEFTPANGVITGVKAATGFVCRADEPGTKTVCTIPEFRSAPRDEPFEVFLRSSSDRRGGVASVTATATADLPETNPADNQMTKGFAIYRWISVTTAADSGAGSLREAIHEANANCTPGPCRIVFEIPPPVPDTGYFTITPAEPLPSVTAERVTLEGSRQTTFTGNTNPRGPEIAIDGRLARRGMRMLARCEAVVEGLAIGNFDEDQGLWFSSGDYCDGRPDIREIHKNHIGMDPLGEARWPNRRGLRLDFTSGVTVRQNVIAHNTYSGIWAWRGNGVTIRTNYFEGNGASAILVGPEMIGVAVNDNVIRDHPHMGLAIVAGARSVSARRNLMRNNGGLAIDWGLDGMSPVDDDDHGRDTNAPVVLSAVYDAASKGTYVTFTIKTTLLGPYFNFGEADIFANVGPDGDGEVLAGTADYLPPLKPGETRTLWVAGDHRGKWINMTWTRRHEYGAKTPPIDTQSHDTGFGMMTSELSNSVLVQ
jgi:parallel beta-helix repeat protein